MTQPLDAPLNSASALADRVTRVRTRAADGTLDRGLLLAGGILLPLGLLVIVLGWMGAAQTVLLFEQIPYLVSGGFLGLALVFAGGFVYFTYWQTLSVREARVANRELLAALGRIEMLLVGDAGSASEVLFATPSGTMAHRAGCSVLGGRADVRKISDPSGFETCQLCRPR